jgi:hypothetical protein
MRSLNSTAPPAAVRYLAHAKTRWRQPKKIEEAIDAVLKSADYRSRLHVRHLGWSLKKFGAAFPKHNVNEIHRHHLEDWLNAQSYGAKTWLNYLRDFNILFNFAVSRGWTAIRRRTSRSHPPWIPILRSSKPISLRAACQFSEHILPGRY